MSSPESDGARSWSSQQEQNVLSATPRSSSVMHSSPTARRRHQGTPSSGTSSLSSSVGTHSLLAAPVLSGSTAPISFDAQSRKPRSRRASRADKYEPSGLSSSQTTSTSVDLSDLPQRDGVEDCSYFLKTGTCSYRMNCKFNHPLALAGSLAGSLGTSHQQQHQRRRRANSHALDHSDAASMHSAGSHSERVGDETVSAAVPVPQVVVSSRRAVGSPTGQRRSAAMSPTNQSHGFEVQPSTASFAARVLLHGSGAADGMSDTSSMVDVTEERSSGGSTGAFSSAMSDASPGQEQQRERTSGGGRFLVGSFGGSTAASTGDFVVNVHSEAVDREKELIELRRIVDHLANEMYHLRRHSRVFPWATDASVRTLNVGGRPYAVHESVLARFPASRLAKLLASTGRGDASAPYVDRNPVYFEVILEFMRSEMLVVPHGLSRTLVRAEAEYWDVLQSAFPDAGDASAQRTFHAVVGATSFAEHVRRDETMRILSTSGPVHTRGDAGALVPVGPQWTAVGPATVVLELEDAMDDAVDVHYSISVAP